MSACSSSRSIQRVQLPTHARNKLSLATNLGCTLCETQTGKPRGPLAKHSVPSICWRKTHVRIVPGRLTIAIELGPTEWKVGISGPTCKLVKFRSPVFNHRRERALVLPSICPRVGFTLRSIRGRDERIHNMVIPVCNAGGGYQRVILPFDVFTVFNE